MIRQCTIEDIDQVYKLMCELENKQLDYENFRTIFLCQHQHPEMFHFVKVNNGEIVAFLNLRFEYQLHHCEKIAEVMEFIVNNQFRSMGIGKEMFQYVCQFSRENNCSQIELATNQLRHDAHRFYEREGMSNFHYKYSMRLDGNIIKDNKIGN